MDDNSGVIDRVFKILEVLAYAQKPLGLSNIVDETNLSKSTTHRLLQTLLNKGYVAKNLENKYSIGPKYIELASYHINSLELQSEATPFLSLLYSQLKLTVVLGVLQNYKLMYITKLDLYPTTKGFEKIGYETPAYCSSIGKTLLATLSGKELNHFFDQCELTRLTENTITDPFVFKDHLKQVRNRGWAMDDEESQMDHRCVACPIYDYSGLAIASVGVSGTKEQLSDDKLQAIIREVQKTAEQISKRMGYTE